MRLYLSVSSSIRIRFVSEYGKRGGKEPVIHSLHSLFHFVPSFSPLLSLHVVISLMAWREKGREILYVFTLCFIWKFFCLLSSSPFCPFRVLSFYLSVGSPPLPTIRHDTHARSVLYHRRSRSVRGTSRKDMMKVSKTEESR